MNFSSIKSIEIKVDRSDFNCDHEIYPTVKFSFKDGICCLDDTIHFVLYWIVLGNAWRHYPLRAVLDSIGSLCNAWPWTQRI